MKKLFLTGIGFFLAIGLTFAQVTTPEEATAKVVTELSQKLTLNEDQKAAVSAIILDQNKTVSAILENKEQTAEQKVEAVSKLQNEADTKISGLLTDDQKTIYQQVIAERPSIVAPTLPVSTEQKENSTEESNNNLEE